MLLIAGIGWLIFKPLPLPTYYDDFDGI